MKNTVSYIGVALFALSLISAGCAARTGPIRGESNVQGDAAATESRSESSTQKDHGAASGEFSGSASGSGAVSGSGSGAAN